MEAAVEKRKPAGKKDDSWGFAPGDEIAPGRFALDLLGGGHRYEAYLASDEAMLCPVVIKIVRPSRVSDERALDGLAAEAAALAALNHPVIARGFDAVLSGERPHIVLEHLEGPRLSTLMRRHGVLPLEQLIPLALQLSAGLHYMHGQGLVHLDVKPRNIIMGAPPRLIDLSIAKTIAAAASLDVPVGTDRYMAPEQCRQSSAAPFGPPADMWGLGTTLYEAVSSALPFSAPSEADPYPQVSGDLRPLGKPVPPRVAEVIFLCLQRDPSARPSARELAESLEPLVAALPRRPVLNRLRPRWR